MYLCFRYVKSDQNIIMLNLCGSFVLSYLIFISAVEETGNEVHIYINMYDKNLLIYNMYIVHVNSSQIKQYFQVDKDKDDKCSGRV